MPYTDLNSRIAGKINQDRNSTGNRHRLIFYALDESLLPNELYHGFPEWFKQTFKDDDCKKSNWIFENHSFFCLYWVRLFFEETDGRSYFTLVENKLGISRRMVKGFFSVCVNSHILDPIESDSHCRPNTQKMLIESWVFMRGPTSEIWRSLIPLVRALPPEQDADELNDCVEELLADLAHVPFSLEYLAENRDDDFIDSLKWIRSDNFIALTGYQQYIKDTWNKHGYGNSANIGWVIETTPGRMRLFLDVRDLTLLDNRKSIQFCQDGRTAEYLLNHCSHEPLSGGGFRYHRLSFTPRDIQEIQHDATNLRFNPNTGFEVRYGELKRGEAQKVAGLQLDDSTLEMPLVFKWQKNKLYAWQLNPEIERVHFSPKLVLIWPNEDAVPPRLKWGDMLLDGCVSTDACEVQFVGKKNLLRTQVVTIPGNRLNGSQPLVWVDDEDIEHMIVRVGTKPMFEADKFDPDIRLVNSDTQIVFDDNRVTLHLKNLPAGETISIEDIVVTNSDDCLINGDGRSVALTMPYATEVKLRYRQSNTGIRVMRFPEEIRNVVLGTVEVDDWEWRDANMDWTNANDIKASGLIVFTCREGVLV